MESKKSKNLLNTNKNNKKNNADKKKIINKEASPKNKHQVVFFKSIRFRLVAAFLVPVIAIVILGLTSYNRASDAMKEQYMDQTLQTADVLNQYIDLIISSEKEEFKAYLVDKTLSFYFKGSLDSVASNNAKVTYKDALLSKLVLDSKLSDLYFIGNKNTSLSGNPMTFVDTESYDLVMNSATGEAIMANPNDWNLFGQDPELDAMLGLNQGGYAMRYIRKFTNLDALMILDFSAATFREALNILDPGENGYVVLVTSDGKEFYADETITESGKVFGQSFYTTAVSNEEASGNMIVKMEGQNYLFTYSKITENGDMVVALIPEADILAQTANIKMMTMIITIIASIVSIALAALISGQMTSVINYILKKLSRVAEGDLTTHLRSGIKDEFGLLCEGINNTVGNVKGLIEGVNGISIEVNSSAENMANASSTFKSTSVDIQSAVSRIENGTESLDTNSADCLEQMDTLSGMITEVSANTEEIERLTEATGKTIATGIKSVQGLSDSADATSRVTNDVISAISELEAKLEEVHKIVAAINNIAKRTNLLSLNASIEAARAGEAGRGFTVVAEEIRELSNQCMSSANQISDIVKEVAEKTTDVVKIAGQAEEIVASQTEAVEDTKASFDTINSQVTGLIEALNVISDNIRKMDSSRSATLKSIESISEISAETVACSDAVNTATNTQSSMIDGLDTASEQLSEKATALIEMLKKFVV